MPSPLVLVVVCISAFIDIICTLNHIRCSSKSVEGLAHQWVSDKKPSPDPLFLPEKQRSVPKVVRVRKTHSFMPVCPEWCDVRGVFVHAALPIASSGRENPIFHLLKVTNEAKSQGFDILLLYSPGNTSIKNSLQFFLGGTASWPPAGGEAPLGHEVSSLPNAMPCMTPKVGTTTLCDPHNALHVVAHASDSCPS